MWRWWVLVGLFVGFIRVAYAEEAVLNDPPSAMLVAKTVINKLDPSYETVWNWAGGTFSQGVSASLWNVKSSGIPVGNLRIGYATGETLYGSVGLDLPGLTKRFVPAQIKGIATVQPLDTLWMIAGTYARVSGFVGHTWNSHDRMAYGMTFGAAVNF